MFLSQFFWIDLKWSGYNCVRDGNNRNHSFTYRVTVVVLLLYDVIHAKRNSFSCAYARDRTKENEFPFAWMTSHNNRKTKVTRSDPMSKWMTSILSRLWNQIWLSRKIFHFAWSISFFMKWRFACYQNDCELMLNCALWKPLGADDLTS